MDYKLTESHIMLISLQALDSDILCLPQCVHRTVAILLVETCALRLSSRPGGIPVDVFKETPGILEQVVRMFFTFWNSFV